jgi:DNA-directed RNA polymerase subunit F
MTEYKPLTISEVKEILEKESGKRELNFEQKAALQHAVAFGRLTPEKARKLVSDLQKIENITEPLAVKITDMLPEHIDDLRVILAKERFVQDPKNIDLIMKTVEQYLRTW